MTTFSRRAFASLLLAGLLSPAIAQAMTELKPWKSGATPPLELKDAQGASHSLAALKGKVVLVNFWATFCEPCRAEMPAMARLKKAMGDDLVVLAVNYGESEEKGAAFLETLPQGAADALTVLYDHDSGVSRRWKASILPASFIIGRNGRVAYALIGEVEVGVGGGHQGRERPAGRKALITI